MSLMTYLRSLHIWAYQSIIDVIISCRFLTPSFPTSPVILYVITFLKINYKMVMSFINGWFLFWFRIQMDTVRVETFDHCLFCTSISNDINLHMPDFYQKSLIWCRIKNVLKAALWWKSCLQFRSGGRSESIWGKY